MTCKILLPVDGSDGSNRAARHVAYIAATLKNVEVHVVNVQPLGDDWMVRRMIKPDELASMEQQWSATALAPAQAILQHANTRFTSHVVQGDVPKAIVQLAKELDCNQIVMGTRGLSIIGDMLLGSVAHKVLHLSDIPVTLVK